jgi:hypothetical protein
LVSDPIVAIINAPVSLQALQSPTGDVI